MPPKRGGAAPAKRKDERIRQRNPARLLNQRAPTAFEPRECDCTLLGPRGPPHIVRHQADWDRHQEWRNNRPARRRGELVGGGVQPNPQDEVFELDDQMEAEIQRHARMDRDDHLYYASGDEDFDGPRIPDALAMARSPSPNDEDVGALPNLQIPEAPLAPNIRAVPQGRHAAVSPVSRRSEVRPGNNGPGVDFAALPPPAHHQDPVYGQPEANDNLVANWLQDLPFYQQGMSLSLLSPGYPLTTPII